MTKEELEEEIKAIAKDETLKKSARKVLKHHGWLYGAWTHCYSCHRSNQRLNCMSIEDYIETRNECVTGKWKCSFCGGNLEVNAGYSNGEGDVSVLPTREEIIEKIKEESNVGVV